MRLSSTIMMLLLGSCRYSIPDIPSVPANPTYDNNVRRLLADHCLVCHASPPDRDAPGYFRLDAYDDDATSGVLGAKSMASAILADVKSSKMPPSAKSGDGVGPNGLAMLQAWVDSGAPR